MRFACAARRTAAVLALLLPIPGSGQGTALTIDRLLDVPFPSALTTAPTGSAVAWVLNERGARNIWVATTPAWTGRRLTAYTADDGQEISSLAWTTDGRTLLFVRGGARNRAGEVPNPALDPKGAETALWRVALDGGAPVRIGPGASPMVSPRGDGAVFSRGKLWWLPLGAGAGEPVELVNVRGALSSTRWSPDGSKLAFVSARGDHSFVGVYDVAQRTVRFLAPSVDRDGSPAWSPDGSRLAFVRIPASSELFMFRAQRAASPWSILVADVATGTTRTVFTADEGHGSVAHAIVGPDQLMWGAGDHLVFPWEKTGWTLLYSISASGGTPRLLTPGAFEVEYARITRDGREVLFNSNQGDIDRRHLWRVPVSGGPPVALTRGEGIEWEPVDLAGGSVAFLRSDARTPAHAALLAPGGATRALAPEAIAGAFPSAAHVVPQAVMITATDGMQIPAQLFLPAGRAAGERRPAAIFFHGGSRRQMLLGYHYGEYYHKAYALNQYLASRGFVVLSVNYRSGTGYGLEFREAERYGAAGASEFNDVVGAGLYLRGRADVDPARIALWGGSYGGYLTAMGLARAPELFATGVDIHGVHDWNVGIRTFVPSYDTLEVPEAARLARASSPLAYMDRWKAPVLVIHGDDDRNVSFAETITLVQELRRRRIEVEQLVLPDEVHSFLRHASWLAVQHATAEFLERRMGVGRGRR